MPKVSVVLAVFNVERYIEKCAVSLFEQSLDDIEYIFVDDCSTDKSIEILLSVLNRYPNRKHSVKIIRNEENSKVAFTRTVGMKAATGDFVIHCDPDDFVDSNYYEVMYNLAIENKSDIVATNYYSVKNGIRQEIRNRYYSSNPKDCIKKIYQYYFFPSLCTHLIKRSLYLENNIYPYKDINTGEDLNVLLRVFYYANKITFLDKAFYHYIMRNTSLTHNRDVMFLWKNNISKNLNRIIEFFQSTGDCDYSIMLNFFKFTKKQIMLSATPPQIKLWYSVYPECRKDILRFSNLSLLRKIMYIIFSYFYPAMWLYYKFR